MEGKNPRQIKGWVVLVTPFRGATAMEAEETQANGTLGICSKKTK